MPSLEFDLRALLLADTRLATCGAFGYDARTNQ